MVAPIPSETVLSIWSCLIEPERDTLPIEVARYIIGLSFPPANLERMNQLAAKSRDGSLSPEENNEIEEYRRAGNALAILQSKARLALKN